MRIVRWTPLAAIALLLCLAPASAFANTTDRQIAADATALVAAKGGPPGVIVTLTSNGRTRSINAGRRYLKVKGPPRLDDHTRLASITKAYTGAIVLRLVDQERISLDDTVGEHLPDMPLAWQKATIRQLLNHTSGIPDYTKSVGFFTQFQTNPEEVVPPSKIIDWVRAEPLLFPSGSKYEYSNTDNIIAALIAEKTSNRTYPNLLQMVVFAPLNLRNTSLPTTTALHKTYIHGYVAEVKGGKTSYEDVSTILSPTGAWASGGIESTPRDLGTFVRGLLAKRFFGTRIQRQQFKWVKNGHSSPAGPGKNSAGLSLFRYETRCGTVYGHTGNFPGYVQFAAADRTGKRSVTTSLNIPAPSGKLLSQLRELQTKAVCRVFGK